MKKRNSQKLTKIDRFEHQEHFGLKKQNVARKKFCQSFFQRNHSPFERKSKSKSVLKMVSKFRQRSGRAKSTVFTSLHENKTKQDKRLKSKRRKKAKKNNRNPSKNTKQFSETLQSKHQNEVNGQIHQKYFEDSLLFNLKSKDECFHKNQKKNSFKANHQDLIIKQKSSNNLFTGKKSKTAKFNHTINPNEVSPPSISTECSKQLMSPHIESKRMPSFCSKTLDFYLEDSPPKSSPLKFASIQENFDQFLAQRQAFFDKNLKKMNFVKKSSQSTIKPDCNIPLVYKFLKKKNQKMLESLKKLLMNKHDVYLQ